MDANELGAEAERAARLVEEGAYPEALEVLDALLLRDLTDDARAVMNVNAAVVHASMGDSQRSLAAYDRAVEAEASLGRIWASELRAAYLVEVGRRDEALAAYRDLLDRPDLAGGDRGRVEYNVARLAGG